MTTFLLVIREGGFFRQKLGFTGGNRSFLEMKSDVLKPLISVFLSPTRLRQKTVKFSLRYEDVAQREMPFNKSARNDSSERNRRNTPEVLAGFL